MLTNVLSQNQIGPMPQRAGSANNADTQKRAAEARLVQAALDGDLSAFNCLVTAHQDPLYGWIYAMVKDDALADDLTQAALITAYEKLHTFRGGSFRAWLFTIARNRTIDEMRRKKRFPAFSLDAPFEEEDPRSLLSFLADDHLQPEAALEQAEQAELIDDLLEALPEPARQVLRLVDMDGMDYQEAAEVLRLPIGTVKSRLTRARLKLREIMQECKLM